MRYDGNYPIHTTSQLSGLISCFPFITLLRIIPGRGMHKLLWEYKRDLATAKAGYKKRMQTCCNLLNGKLAEIFEKKKLPLLRVKAASPLEQL